MSDMSDESERVVEFGEYYLHEDHGEVIAVEIFEHVETASAVGVLESELSVRYDKKDDSNYTWPRVMTIGEFIEATEEI